MHTECPHCHTVFRVSEQQLAQAEGQVRCGHCLAIFTADNPYSNHQETRLQAEIADSKTSIPDEISSLDPATDIEILPDVIPPGLRAESRSPKNHSGFFGSLLLSLSIIAMIVIGVAQYAFYNRITLVQHNELRPWLGLLCKYAQCDLPDPRNTKLIELSSKNIFSHPNIPQALMVSATIVNLASFEQKYPLLELRFENIRGETIAARRFLPEEYLGIPENQITQMEPNNPISFNIEIIDPGKDMVSYEFNFL
ncbi:MAG: DUF3426 domain-containing protein [Gammaproteobacteria bacterium]|nr:DUF3426 domain-containing protein [Gammaproteobacteria bacterium]